MSLNLTKKEKEFLVDWLTDDLGIQLKTYYVSECDTIVKPLRSILKKLKKDTNEGKFLTWKNAIKSKALLK